MSLLFKGGFVPMLKLATISVSVEAGSMVLGSMERGTNEGWSHQLQKRAGARV